MHTPTSTLSVAGGIYLQPTKNKQRCSRLHPKLSRRVYFEELIFNFQITFYIGNEKIYIFTYSSID